MRRRCSDQSGFTMIEVLVAALILVIGIVGAMGGFIDASKATQTAQRQDVASAVATQAIEQIRDLPYANQAVDAAYPSPAPASGPQTSISGSNFTTQDGQTEPLVTAVSTSGIDPVSYLDAQTGTPQSSCAVVASGHQCATVYRFVSWRKETCPTINLSTLLGSAATSGSLLSQIAQLQTTLTSLSTSITTDQRNPVAGGVVGLLGPLLGTVNATVGTLDTSLSGLSTAIAPAQSALAGPLATLQTAITSLQTGIAALPGGSLATLDLCSLPNLNLASLTALATALTSAQAVLGSASLSTALADANNQLTAIGNLSAAQILAGLVTTIDGALSTDTSTINTSTAAINATLGSLVDTAGNPKTLSQIATDTLTNVQALVTWVTNNAAANVQQTKRITVAVVLNTANDEVGVRQPVWMSSVSTDPKAGLFL